MRVMQRSDEVRSGVVRAFGPVRLGALVRDAEVCGVLWHAMERLATLRFGVSLSGWPRFGAVRASSDAGKVC